MHALFRTPLLRLWCDACGSIGHPTSNCGRLKELFLPFGKITKTTVVKDQTTGLSKGYGFVKFENPLDAAAAMAYMNGYKMDGKMLAVRVAGQKPVPGPLHPGNAPTHSSHTNVPCNALCQKSSIYGPPTSILPEAPFSTA
ncbi:UNVERIFIED_CONTAM: Splicing factor-like protein 1 [Sesamum calycinum]|uniref:Splicing factor-like protein 1 n=1 Tax=Sesamum calycinum TaxID=2727403 RepID=A0AAW2QWM7_9LAMI